MAASSNRASVARAANPACDERPDARVREYGGNAVAVRTGCAGATAGVGSA